MKRKDFPLLITLVCLAMGLLTLADTTKLNTSNQPPPLRCPDINVLSFSAKLVSTTAGNPGVEFPRDSIVLTVEIVKAGNLPPPPGVTYRISFFRKNSLSPDNVELPASSGYFNTSPNNNPNLLFYRNMPDTFPHGLQTTYTVVVGVPFQECTTANNKASFTINEGQLHAVQARKPRF
jgi:hypothetical protein